MAAQQKSLKRLAPVESVLNLGTSVAKTGVSLSLYFYTLAKERLAPQALVPTLQKAEDAIASNLTPMVAKGQDIANELLYYADDEVDVLISSLFDRVNNVKSAARSSATDVNHATQAVVGATYLTARDIASYLNHSTQAVVGATYLTARDIGSYVANTSGVKAATELLYAGLAKAQEVSDPDAAVQMASDAWAAWASYPPIAAVLNVTEPVSSRSMQVFQAFHDSLVHNRYYKSALDLTTQTLDYARTTTPYKLGAQYVYPMLQPVADPAIDKVTKSKVINQTVEFWKPVVI